MEGQNVLEPPKARAVSYPYQLTVVLGWLVLGQHALGQLMPLVHDYFAPRMFYSTIGFLPFSDTLGPAYRLGPVVHLLVGGGMLAASRPLALGRSSAPPTAISLASILLVTQGLSALSLLSAAVPAMLFGLDRVAPLMWMIPEWLSPLILALAVWQIFQLAAVRGEVPGFPLAPPEAVPEAPAPRAGPRTMVLSYVLNTAPTRLRRTGAVLLRAFALLLGLIALGQLVLLLMTAVRVMGRPGGAGGTGLSTPYWLGFVAGWGFLISLFVAFAVICLVMAKLVKAGSRGAALTAMIMCWPLELTAIAAAARSFAAFVVNYGDPHRADVMAALVAHVVIFAVALPASVLMLDVISVFRFIAAHPMSESNFAPGRLTVTTPVESDGPPT